MAALTCAMLLASVPALSADARGQPWNSVTHAFVNCDTSDSTLQICDPPAVDKVRVARGAKVIVKRLRYVAADEHCSSGRLLIYLDGKRLGRTDWVEAGEASTVERLHMTLRHRRGGKAHRFQYRFQGRTGGCNAGLVGGWGGDVKLTGAKSRA